MSAHEGLPRGSDSFVEAFARGLAVIRAFGPECKDPTLSEVAERAGLSPAGARRLLHTLVALGYAKNNGRTFSLTPAILDLGYSYLSSLSLREIALPYVEQFAKEHGEVCSLSVLDRTDIMYVARAEIRGPSARIEAARKSCYAFTDQQLEFGICGLSVPVKDRNDGVVGALTTSVNIAKHEPDSVIPTFLSSLQELASAIGNGLTP